jgi:CHAT domain-containing protein/Flp pilus assembly protein TadD
MIETGEELIQEDVDTDLAAGRAFLVSGKDSVSPVPKRSEKTTIKNFRGRALLIAILFIAVISSLSWLYYSRNSIDRQTTAALDNTYTNGRPLESWITGLKYAPFTTTRGEDKEIQSDALRQTELNLLNAVVNDKSARNRHALGRFYLAKQEFENAIRQLEEAEKIAPNDARILTDLGTAYLEKSRTIPDEQGGQQLKMRAMAMEEFEKAVEADPKMPEAVFNRSICRQLLVLPFQTRQSWQDYLDLDPSSKWAEEARRRLEQVETVTLPGKNSDALLQDFMSAYRARDDEQAYRIVSRNREMITGKLIPQRLAKLITESDGDQKSEYLSALEYIGKLENERSGDPFFLELAKFYSSASKEKLAAMRQAQEAVFRGYGSANNSKDALAEFQNAQKVFQENGNTWEAAICSYWIGYILSNQSHVNEGTATLETALTKSLGYKWLSAQYLNWLGYNMNSTRQLSKALEYNQRSLELAGQTNDYYLDQKALSQKTTIYRRLGQYREAIDTFQKVLRASEFPEASERQKWRDLDVAASLFFDMKYFRVSAIYEKEAQQLAAARLEEKTFDFESNLKLGMIHGARRDNARAFASFESALDIAKNFSDEKLRRKSFAIAKLQYAHAKREAGSCADALNDYNEALTFYDTGEYRLNQYEAHKGRLICYVETKNDEAVRVELPVILSLFRDYREKILEEQNRNTFFDSEQDSYDIAVDYEFGRQNLESAFDYSEESRARSLLDMQTSPVEVVQAGSFPEIKFPAAITEPLKLSQMLPEIPQAIQVIQYSVLKDKTLIWLITRGGYSVVKSEIGETALREKISAYLELLKKHDASEAEKAGAAARELYGLLLDPVKDKLDPAKEICIIPDKSLFQLSFPALVSPASNKYFLTEYTVISAPSLNVFLNSSRMAAKYAGITDETILSIGDPAFNEKDFPGLPRIRSAKVEAEKIGRSYGPKSSILNEGNALKKDVIAKMPGADVMHFGGHYIVNDGSPLLSGFVLSEDPRTHTREDSILSNYEILGDKLSNTRLIVLAACRTGVETYYGGEGMIGASRTFLAAGVPLVVASQWAVDSESTAELMVRFHRSRKTGNLSTAQALRRAQLDMLEGDNESYRDPYYWAGFVTFGGYAQF